MSQAYVESEEVSEAKALAAELCRDLSRLGWFSGTGGSITIKVHDHSIPRPHQLIVMSPSGVQKERMVAEDMYVLSSDGFILSTPPLKPYPYKHPKCTDCAPLFMKAYEVWNAGAVIHSHGLEACLVTMINPFSKEFRITHMEMIKGIQGHGYHDELKVPIIENTAHEGQLTESLTEAMRAYPKTKAILVRNHGVYVWGDSWISAKTQAECYHYLFEAAIKLHQLGLDWSSPNHGSLHNVKGLWGCCSNFNGGPKVGNFGLDYINEPSLLLLAIEGTVIPISYVTDTLLPFACNNVGKHLALTYDTEETQRDIDLLRSQILADLEQGVKGAMPIPPDTVGKDLVIASLAANVEAMINSGRKLTCLKQLQGHIWRTGFQSKELAGVLFEDVPEAFVRWQTSGTKVYSYSSISREVQQLLFAYSNYGDIRKYLCGYFDSTVVVGNKQVAHSYFEILLTVGVDRPEDMLFVTDSYQHALAARAAGLEVIISIRPGNGPLPVNHGFRTIASLLEI